MPAPDSERAPGQGRPNSQKYGSKKQRRHYHSLDEVQVFLLALSPLWAVILLAIYLRGAQ